MYLLKRYILFLIVFIDFSPKAISSVSNYTEFPLDDNGVIAIEYYNDWVNNSLIAYQGTLIKNDTPEKEWRLPFEKNFSDEYDPEEGGEPIGVIPVGDGIPFFMLALLAYVLYIKKYNRKEITSLNKINKPDR